MNESGHTPVLLDEVLHGLKVQPRGIYVDCTFGRGGHSRAILRQLSPEGRVLAFDKDPQAVTAARGSEDPRLEVLHASFARLQDECAQRNWTGHVAGVLFDLGVSSPQLDEGERGFSFARDGKLDMRFNPGSGPSAAEWLAGASESEIAGVLKHFGEERYARRIAAAIVRAREQSPIVRTSQLRELVTRAVPTREENKDPATRTFQAIRIYINSELEELEQTLPQAVTVLAPGGRLAVISFHSLEDRIVKRFMRRQATGGNLPDDLPVRDAEIHRVLKRVGRPLRPGDHEIRSNPRSRSAILRIAEKLEAA